MGVDVETGVDGDDGVDSVGGSADGGAVIAINDLAGTFNYRDGTI